MKTLPYNQPHRTRATRSLIMSLLQAVALLALIMWATSHAAPLNLIWNPNRPADNVTEYRVYRLDGTTRTLLTKTSTTRATLEVNGGETVIVTAFNGIESPPSAPVTLPLRPAAPEGLRIEITITLPSP